MKSLHAFGTDGRLEALFETIPLSIAIFDSDLRLVTNNAQYRDLMAAEADFVATPGVLSIYDAFPNALADLTDQIDSAVRGGIGGPAMVPFQHTGGQKLIEATFASIAEDSGRRGLVFAGKDVTDREHLRVDLNGSIAQLASIFDVMPDAVRFFDSEGHLVRSNAQAHLDHPGANPATLRELWQLDRPRTMDGTSLFMHEHPASRAMRGQRVRGEILVVRRGSEGMELYIEVNSNPLYDDEHRIRGAVAVERDVTVKTQLARQLEEEAKVKAELFERVSTEAERLERMVEERTQELLALQEARSRERRLAAVGQLAAGVMHDVNNALNPIMAAAYLLEANANNPTAVRDYAVRIAKAAETGAATAARVGRFIRQEPLQGEREEIVDLSAICEEVIAITRPVWAERTKGGEVDLKMDLAPTAVMHGIPGELREALMNLVQNALDAMKGGGRLTLRTEMSATEVRVEVTDTGMGMSAEVRERAFEPFFTTKGHAGTGLGLAEVYGIVRRHRGQTQIESLPGLGTTIRMVFPRSQTFEGLLEQVQKSVKAQPRRILLVEDHVDSLEFMKAVLDTNGHEVAGAGTVAEAMAHLDRAGEPFDVLLTDIGLPDGSGWDLITSAKARFPAIRTGVVTGWAPNHEDEARADFTLRKPVPTAELLARVSGDA
jgi:signal transduction histidine kinase